MKKRMLVLTLILSLTLVFAATASAATLDDIPDNTMRIGNDFYDFTSSYFSDSSTILNSLNAGTYIYVKLNGYWYDLTVLTDAQIMNPSYAESETDLNSWSNLGTWYGAGTAIEEMTDESGPTGTYTITDFNAFTKSFNVTVSGLDDAAYFNVSNNGTALSNSPVAISEGLVNVGSVFSDTSVLSVEFYSDAAGETLLATASLSDGNLTITLTGGGSGDSDFQVIDIY